MAASPTVRYTGRYVFIAGLHRTGTSLVAGLLASHSEIASIEGSPAPENEGCYLQGAIPHTALHGIPGVFAADPAQHHIEGSRFDRMATRDRMGTDWARWFSRNGKWRMEKSPVNLTRMRLYQQLFPMAQFIVILRHPEAMAAAMVKWTDQSASALIDYGLDAYDALEEDLRYLHASLVIRYEDLVAEPECISNQMFRFLELTPKPPAMSMRNGNAEYSGCSSLTEAQGRRAFKWGYEPGLRTSAWSSEISHPLRSVREAVIDEGGAAKEC